MFSFYCDPSSFNNFNNNNKYKKCDVNCLMWQIQIEKFNHHNIEYLNAKTKKKNR